MKKIFAILVTFTIILSTFTACDSSEYKKAIELMNHENYNDAAIIFAEISDYKDSSEMLERCNYEIALECFNSQKYEQAIEMFQRLGDYKDCAVKISECKKGMANNYFSEGEYELAIPLFEEFENYEAVKDCKWGMLIDYFAENDKKIDLVDGGRSNTFTITPSNDKNGLVINYIVTDSSGTTKLNYEIKKENPNQIFVIVSGEVGGLPESGNATVDLRTYKKGDSLNWDNKNAGTELVPFASNNYEFDLLNILSSTTTFTYNKYFESTYEKFQKLLEVSGLEITLEDLGIGV